MSKYLDVYMCMYPLFHVACRAVEGLVHVLEIVKHVQHQADMSVHLRRMNLHTSYPSKRAFKLQIMSAHR